MSAPTTQAAPQLTEEAISTHYNNRGWTAWLDSNRRIWGVGKTEAQAIANLWQYQGLLTAEEAHRIEQGEQEWQQGMEAAR